MYTTNQFSVRAPTKVRSKPTFDWLEDRSLPASNLLDAFVANSALAGLTGVSDPSRIEIAKTTNPTALSVSTSQVRASAVSSILDSKVTPYDLTTKAGLTFNLGTGSYYTQIEITKGVTYDTDKIKELESFTHGAYQRFCHLAALGFGQFCPSAKGG